MNLKVQIEIGSIQKTLFLPVWARATETKKHKPLLNDITAVKIIDSVDFDFKKMSETISEVIQISWIARCKRFDNIIKDFAEHYPNGIIVNIGCGLDTTYDRLKNNSIVWYDLDLPDVIELRKKFLTETEKRKFISSSFLDTAWFKTIKNTDNVLFISTNVFCYFEENQIKEFIKKIANTFYNSEMFFDVASAIGVKFGNKLLEKAGMNSDSFFKWGLKDQSIIPTWDQRIKLLNIYKTFKIKGLNLSLKNKLIGFLSDLSKNYYMIHLKIS